MMRKLIKNGGVYMWEEVYDEKQIICGRTADKLDIEELELYRFMIGGMQGK